MKTKLISLMIFITIISANSQELPSDFFEKNGTVAMETKELNAKADTLAVIRHRKDDIVWSKVIYRIIDLREMQNRVLFNPVQPTEENKSLFRIIAEGVINNGLNAYEVPDMTFMSTFKKTLTKKTLFDKFKYYRFEKGVLLDTTYVFASDGKKDSISEGYNDYARRQYKFLIKEIVFFNKHYSKMYTKIIGIAPIYNYTLNNLTFYHQRKETPDWFYFIQSVPCWFLYDELRPLLSKYYIKDSNKTIRMTFDDFFQMKLYSSYILGDDNTTDRMLLQSYKDETRIKYEQDRIEREILNVEQDVWEY